MIWGNQNKDVTFFQFIPLLEVVLQYVINFVVPFTNHQLNITWTL